MIFGGTFGVVVPLIFAASSVVIFDVIFTVIFVVIFVMIFVEIIDVIFI